MDKIFIVDAVNILFRSYYAISPMTNVKGESTNALFGFIRSIYKLINDFSPNYFIAVFDGPDNKKSRTQIYEHYKSHREGMPGDLVFQLEKAMDFCQLAGIPHLCIPGVEADDTIGSITKWMEKKEVPVYICSSDKDLCQLVGDHVFVVSPHKDHLIIDKAKVKEIYGVYPEQIVDYLAMTGDASDNIPGLEGFGPKTASLLLSIHGTLENILNDPEKLSGKKKETVIRGKEIALMSKKLATIHTNVEFPTDDFFFHLKEPDLEAVKKFYQEMRFLSLLKEISNQEQENVTQDYQLIDSSEKLQALISILMQEKQVCVDTETTSIQPMQAQIVGIGFGVQPGTAWYVPFNAEMGKDEILAQIKPLLENTHIGWVGHNLKYDLHVLANAGITLKNVVFDTILASYLLNPHTQRHNLDDLSLEILQKTKISIEDLIGKGKNQTSMDQVPLEEITTYCCEDVDYTLRLKKVFKEQLTQRELTNVFEQIEIPLIPILTQMERNGIYVDVDKLNAMSKEMNLQIKDLEQKIYTLAGESFNLNSPKQLSHILFEKMGIKPPKKTATGYSTAADVLESLKKEFLIINEILIYRTLEKLRSTYINALPQQINPQTGRIHCTFNQSVTATGRLSCQDPNLQNIPIRTEEGRKIREAFKPQSSEDCFVSADYSQIELRLLAHFSEDPVLLKAFQEGEDIHIYTASLVFNVPMRDVTEEMRSLAKAVNFGIIYGQQAFGLSQQIGIDYEEADTFIKTYFERYPKVRDFLEFCKSSARTTGKAFTLTGRQRPIPEIHSKNPHLKSAAERLAINTPLQGTAADLIKMAMIHVDGHLKQYPHMGKMILQIHDELLFETPDSEAKGLAHQVKAIMEGVWDLKVPLIVDISIGKNWGAC